MCKKKKHIVTNERTNLHSIHRSVLVRHPPRPCAVVVGVVCRGSRGAMVIRMMTVK